MTSLRMITCLCLCVALISACKKEEPETTETSVEETTSDQPADVVEESTDQKVGSVESFDADREAARKQATESVLTDEGRAAKRAARQARRQAAKAENPKSDSPQTSEEKAAKQAERQQKRRLEKAWWNKGKSDDVFDENQVEQFNQQVVALLNQQQELGAELRALYNSNEQALRSGDLDQLENNLQEITALRSQWEEARAALVLDILSSLDSEQLAALAEQGEKITSLNWMNQELEKGMPDKPKRRDNNDN